MAGFSAVQTTLTSDEITALVINIKATFPNDASLQSIPEIEAFNLYSTASRILPLDCLGDDINLDYVKALWVAHKAELYATGEHRGIKSIENMEQEDGKVEFYDTQNSNANKWNWIDQAETTNRGKELLSYFQEEIMINSIGGTISDYSGGFTNGFRSY